MRRLVGTAPAVADLESIHAYISRDAVVYADAMILEILESAERLVEVPESGSS